ncbi:MAG TPA: AAA family ATPase [Candidatus Hydrogenedentes bacterium]|nr:AAA family ATPase [Candidatus Hydrogenedentota bacterium]HOJ67457.1 AAA family ATPase [Candidatus Hydrogenedentota bacterium]HOK88991.1 AAA family ATPase [Candidatus Hydrogenedentota bacterium]HOV59924.1 AAA family ATPase [Candidatus Hydrogenedentota bacterium]
MTITGIKFKDFTVFEKFNLQPCQGLNVLVGANGTGKTHLMKAAYSACDVSKTRGNFAEKLIRVYLPSGQALGRLVRRKKSSSRCSVEVCRSNCKLSVTFSNHAIRAQSATITGMHEWTANPVESVYIPVKEMLANAPGFRSLYAQREIHFEEIYADILDRAYRPALRGPVDQNREKLLANLKKIIDGKVAVRNDEFFLVNKQGNLEFTLLAEGMRKLGLLWLLIQNGTLLNGSVLFWDEPETNLNPRLIGPLIEILLELQRMGVQIFLATHDYVILKEIDLRRKPEDHVAFHALFRDETSEKIECHSTSQYLDIHPNAISETFSDLYNREIRRVLGDT